jgi:mono/diheme cytochrome c family protein
MSQDTNETTILPEASAPSIPNAHVIEERFRESELSGDIDLRKMHGAILREMSEPSDGSEPIPMWMLAGITALALFCGGYLAFYSGGFRGDVFNYTTDFKPGKAGPAGPVDPRVLGKKVFTANCTACHQSTGVGQPGQFPPLVGSEFVVGDAPNRLVAIVLHGIQGSIKVHGTVYNGAMPAWETLGDEKLAAVLSYVRNEWGNSAPNISKEAVTAIREKTKGQLGNPWTEAQLLAMPPDVSILQLGAAPAAGAAPGAPPAAPGAPPAAPGAPPPAPAPK